MVKIYNKDGGKTFNVHRLIMITFSEEIFCCPTCGSTKEINHKNFDKSDNRFSNLEFVLPSKNKEHAKDKISNGTKKWKTEQWGSKNSKQEI